jgi:hypothetical protein
MSLMPESENEFVRVAVTEFCRLHLPRLEPVDYFWRPDGYRGDGEIDAIVAKENCKTKIAVEVTHCYRGRRDTGEAKKVDDLFNGFVKSLEAIAVECLGPHGYLVKFTFCFAAPVEKLARDTTMFSELPKVVEGLAGQIKDAVLRSGQAKLASWIWPTGVPMPHSSIFHRTSQVYVQQTRGDRTMVIANFREPDPGRVGEWHPYIPLSVWISREAIIDAIEGKRKKLGVYRALARSAGAGGLWLLIVAELVAGWDVLAVLHDEDGELYEVVAKEPQFDEIHLLAGGYWAPAGWDPKSNGLPYAGDLTWRLFQIYSHP